MRVRELTSVGKSGFSRKLTLAFVAVVLVVAMTMPAAFWSFGQIRASSSKASDSAATLSQVRTFQAAIAEMRVAARDYAASSKPADKAALARELNSLTDGVRSIGKTGDGALRMPSNESRRWFALAEQASEAHADLLEGVAAGTGKQAIAAFDARMKRDVQSPADVLTMRVSERVLQADAEIRDSIEFGSTLLLLVLGVAVAVAALLALLIPRRLTTRLNQLREAAQKLAGGDLAARADDSSDTDDEIADLVQAFNAMAHSLQMREHENRMLQHKLEVGLQNEQERATRDPLTSLRNHRYFQEQLGAEIDRCSRSGSVVTIAMIDLDDFKQVNDRFGHHEGDAVLLRVTKGISDNLRPYDLACRLGGEEFGVIFPDTNAEDAQVVLSRIAEHIVGFGPNGERASFSGGIATYPHHAREQAQLYQHADEAAYQAKSNGKNQTVIYDARAVTAMNSEERTRQRSRDAVLNTASTLVSAVDQKDPYARNHSELTAIYAATLARAVELDEETVKLVYRAALLHDVGKVGVADEILRKPGRLTPDEYEQIKQHPELSYRILETAEVEPIATWVRHHHEHWDGSGYPDGLVGEHIPLGSRIVLVADALEAMTSDRVYRRSLTARQALSELQQHAGTQFDPQLAHTMVHLVTHGVFDEVRTQFGKQPFLPQLAPPVHPEQPAADAA